MSAFALAAVACRPGGEAEPAEGASAAHEVPAAAVPAAPEAPQGPDTAAETDSETEAVALANAAPAADPAAADGAEAEVDVVAEPAPEPKDLIPDEPYKVLILGDSLAATGFGAMLEKKLDAHPHVVCYRKGKSASGLARPDFFDWMGESKRQIEFRKPDLVVVIMGGNDGQDLTRLHGKKRVHWNKDDWPVAYRERMDKFLGEVVDDDRKVLWLGLPHMGLRSLEKKLVLIRGIQAEAVAALGDGNTYVDTVPYTTTDEGETLAMAAVGTRSKKKKIRADDKIHFTMSGSEYFADRIYPDVLQALSLPDVEELEESK